MNLGVTVVKTSGHACYRAAFSKVNSELGGSGWQGACRAIRCFGAIGCNNMVKVERILERFSMFFHGTFGVLGAGTGGFLSMSRSVRGH